MPAISKIRLTNVVYEEGNKRYNDEIFLFDGQNGAVLLENGGGKTVFIQTVLQVILPHSDLAERKIKNTLVLENAPAHIAVEWITNEKPRRYVVTAVSLFITKNGLDSLRYVYEYGENDPNKLENIPFVREGKEGKRTAEKGEMQDYYSQMREKSIVAETFQTIKEYKLFLEEQHHIIASEWESISKINSSEGGVEAFFDECKSTNQLFDRLLIPIVENSIVGHDKDMFANTFEQQHTSLKNYKKLKETIEENKKIQTQLEEYTNTYEQLYLSEKEYFHTKQKVKGTWTETLNQMEMLEEQKNNNEEKWKDWHHLHKLFTIKSKSYAILLEEFAYKKMEAEFNDIFFRNTKKEENLKKHEIDYYSLKLAELKKDKKEKADLLKYYDLELAKYDKTEEIQDYEDQLEETKEALLGWFLTEMEHLENKHNDLNYQLNPIQRQLKHLSQQKNDIEEKDKKYRAAVSKSKAIIEHRTKDMDKLRQQLLSIPDQELVHEELEKWQQRSVYLDERIVRLKQEEKQLLLAIQESEKKVEHAQIEYIKMEKEQNECSFQLTQIDEAEKQIINQLQCLRSQWAGVEKIYLLQESIEKRLQESIEKLLREKNDLLLKERVAYRLVDTYGQQDTFFADPFLCEQFISWKNQFDYLVTGVEYFQSLEVMDRKNVEKNFLWSVTLITTSKSKHKLIEKITQVSQQLQFPILVLSTEEVLSIQESSHLTNWIVPAYWQSNMDEPTFLEWQKQLNLVANETTNLREGKEQEVKRWQDTLQALHHFLDKYPFEDVNQLEEELVKKKNDLAEQNHFIQYEKEIMREKREEVEILRKQIEQDANENQGLEGKIEKGHQFILYEKEVEAEHQNEKRVAIQLQQIQQELKKVESIWDGFMKELELLKGRMNHFQTQIHFLKEDVDYKNIVSMKPRYTNENKQKIVERMFDIKLKLREISISQGEWLSKKQAAIEVISSLDKQIQQLLIEHHVVDETIEFPSDGISLMRNLWEQLATIKTELDIFTEELQRKNSLKEQQYGKWQNKVEAFYEEFPSTAILVFEQEPEDISSQLEVEYKKLNERKVFLEQERSRLEKEIQSLEDAKRSLENFVEGHHFNALDIDAIPLNQEEMLDYTYNRRKFVIGRTNELRKNKEQVEYEQKKVDKANRAFREFCRNDISDIKLMQMAINGLESKQNYVDLLQFKKNMLTRVEKISQYANETIRKSDEELQLFINLIHSHLQTLVDEMKQIPKKTKVKVLDDWKQIFSFHIPEWDEETGKTRIRDYMEWILQQLESERFLNETGQQDPGKVRKEIEKWLQSKQLLQIVLNNEGMRVNCRKVTNDNKVTTRSYSWEQSNVWSGGEKWSKNMTLFLGILNYVAEKKKPPHATMKRHRVVILDNPFGKASSDHVLSPVFFIADQLGFQIISLTAHAEGKFLQDYFPIIYSCRLRPSKDASKKIMSKEKWLHHAYFQDHEPETIDRLGETEQIALFD